MNHREAVESPLRGDAHGGFGGRAMETDRKQFRHRAIARPTFASSREGGEGARAEEVHKDEQNCQGGTISSSYQHRPINEGDAYLVVISNPDKIATEPWAGQEVKVTECLS
jgi:hypothetical protein